MVGPGPRQERGVHGDPVAGAGAAHDGHHTVEELLLGESDLPVVVGQLHDDLFPVFCLAAVPSTAPGGGAGLVHEDALGGGA